MELKLELPVPTSLNKLYVNQYKYNPKTKKREPTGAKVLSREGLLVKKKIQKIAKQCVKNNKEWDYDFTLENYLYLDVIIYFNRKGRDDNNTYKLLCDSLEKIVYDNDSRVLIRTQKILYDTVNPRIKVHLYPVEYIGIFNNEQELYTFEKNCQGCKRYKNNCSILKQAKEGRIQKEIDEEAKEKKCDQFKKLST
jgi:hypothetical protein